MTRVVHVLVGTTRLRLTDLYGVFSGKRK